MATSDCKKKVIKISSVDSSVNDKFFYHENYYKKSNEQADRRYLRNHI